MKLIDKEALNARVIAMLEQMCFLLVDPLEVDPGAAPAHEANIEFWSGSMRGSMGLQASFGFLEEVAASLLGLEPEDLSEEDRVAALRELANIACGELIVLLGGEEQRVQCGLPIDGPWTHPEKENVLVSAFDSMGEWFRVSVDLKK